jgi:hypothetical protein
MSRHVLLKQIAIVRQLRVQPLIDSSNDSVACIFTDSRDESCRTNVHSLLQCSHSEFWRRTAHSPNGLISAREQPAGREALAHHRCAHSTCKLPSTAQTKVVEASSLQCLVW